MMSVAWPRIFGPSTTSVTLDDREDEDGDDAAAARAAAARSSRLVERAEVLRLLGRHAGRAEARRRTRPRSSAAGGL